MFRNLFSFKILCQVLLMFLALNVFGSDLEELLKPAQENSLFGRSNEQIEAIRILNSSAKSSMLKSTLEKNLKAENLIFANMQRDKNADKIKIGLNAADSFLAKLKAGDALLAEQLLEDNKNTEYAKKIIEKQIAELKNNDKACFVLSRYSFLDKAPLGASPKEGEKFLYLIYTPIYEKKIASTLYIAITLSADSKAKISYFAYAMPKMQAALKASPNATISPAQKARAKSLELEKNVKSYFASPERKQKITSFRSFAGLNGLSLYERAESQVLSSLEKDISKEDLFFGISKAIEFISYLNKDKIKEARAMIFEKFRNQKMEALMSISKNILREYSNNVFFLTDCDIVSGKNLSEDLDENELYVYFYFDVAGTNPNSAYASNPACLQPNNYASIGKKGKNLSFCMAFGLRGDQRGALAYLSGEAPKLLGLGEMSSLSVANQKVFRDFLAQRKLDKTKSLISSSQSVQIFSDLIEKEDKLLPSLTSVEVENAILKAKEFFAANLKLDYTSIVKLQRGAFSKTLLSPMLSFLMDISTESSACASAILSSVDIKDGKYFKQKDEKDVKYILLSYNLCYLSGVSSKTRLSSGSISSSRYIGNFNYTSFYMLMKIDKAKAASIVYCSDEDPRILLSDLTMAEMDLSIIRNKGEADKITKQSNSTAKNFDKFQMQDEALFESTFVNDKKFLYAIFTAKKFIACLNNDMEKEATKIFLTLSGENRTKAIRSLLYLVRNLSNSYAGETFFNKKEKVDLSLLGLNSKANSEYIALTICFARSRYSASSDYYNFFSESFFDMIIEIDASGESSIVYLEQVKSP